MRYAVVSSRSLAQRGGWLPTTYLPAPLRVAEVLAAQHAVRSSLGRLQAAEEALRADATRIVELHRSGEVLSSSVDLEALLSPGEGI